MDTIFGYTFVDAALLDQACTHVTANRNKNNKSLETLGDSVLAFYVVSELYHYKDGLTQGQLSALKSINLDNENFSRVCYEKGLHLRLKHKIRGFEGRLELFKRDLEDFDTHSNGRMDCIKELADLLEAIVGAVWVDSKQNWAVTRDFIEQLVEPLILDHETYSFRPVHQLWGTGLGEKKGLEEDAYTSVTGRPTCDILTRGGEVFASAEYWGEETSLKNRAAFNALELLRMIKESKWGSQTVS